MKYTRFRRFKMFCSCRECIMILGVTQVVVLTTIFTEYRSVAFKMFLQGVIFKGDLSPLIYGIRRSLIDICSITEVKRRRARFIS